MPKEMNNRKAETKPTMKNQVSRKGVNKFFLYLIIILLLIVIVIGAYYFWLEKKHGKQNLQVLHQQISSNQQDLTDLQTQLKSLGSQQTKLIEQIQNHGFANTQWILSSVVYLLQQAQLKLTIEHDITTTMMLLNTAQKRILSLRDQSLIPLSLAIKKDLSTLAAMNKVDFNNLINQFAVLNKRIADLSMDVLEKKQAASVPLNKQSVWRKALDNSLQTLRNIVVVQRTQRDFTPLLQQQQFVSFKQYLQILTEQAFWGALNGNAALYQQCLSTIKQALQRYLLPSNHGAQLIQQQINSLQRLKIISKWPRRLSALSIAKKIQIKKEGLIQGKQK